MSSDHDGTYSDEEWAYGEDGSDQGSYGSDDSMGDHLDTRDAGEPSTSAGPEWTVLDTAAIKKLQVRHLWPGMARLARSLPCVNTPCWGPLS